MATYLIVIKETDDMGRADFGDALASNIAELLRQESATVSGRRLDPAAIREAVEAAHDWTRVTPDGLSEIIDAVVTYLEA